MGRELLLRSDLRFQSTIRSLDKHLRDAQAPSLPQWALEEELSQPLCTAVQIGLVNMFMAAGVEPQAVVGHSSGEIAGAYAAGALTEKEAIIVAWQRGLAVKKQTKSGAMAAIG
ncbi:polyketide synthase [Penicillium freii]|uniref:Malonyl-CoA:ACP transacylase (MAT) domain-containing protein n=1 Tax=Penicillium freii TaxID=48697 RepID=A0A124GQ16_PENFR|nr:polyketide synthase [Penicillium freii]KUM56706.1 hypothetical protein ACN42_g10502 [Penicillium freii]